jgi:hypothetical protein
LLDGGFGKESEDRATSLDFSSDGVLSPILSGILLALEALLESMFGRLVTAEAGAAGFTRDAEFADRAFWNEPERVSDGDTFLRDTSASGTGTVAAGLLRAFVAGGADVRDVAAPVRSNGAGDVLSAAGVNFSGCRKRFPRVPSPPVTSKIMPITANKHTAATS